MIGDEDSQKHSSDLSGDEDSQEHGNGLSGDEDSSSDEGEDFKPKEATQRILSQIMPSLDRESLQRTAQVGELRKVLNYMASHASHGCPKVLCDFEYTSTLHELVRREYVVEPHPTHPGYVISWEEPHPSISVSSDVCMTDPED